MASDFEYMAKGDWSQVQLRDRSCSTEHPPSSLDDDAHLRRLGKRPLLNRSFGFMSILGLTCSAMLSWETSLVSSVPGLFNGGPAGVVWGCLVNWIGMTSMYAVMAELASIAPTAGGQYHWVFMMAPQGSRRFLSYLTAWLTTTGWQLGLLNTCFSSATLIEGIVVLAIPTYKPEPWHTVLVIWAAMLFALLLNSTTGRVLARFEGMMLIANIVGFFAILVPLVYFSPHNQVDAVFATFRNEGGWPTQGVSFFVGLPNIATTLLGGDIAVHMSEEIQSAAVVVPRALMWTIFINGLLGFAMVIALMFCLGDLEAAMAARETMFYPFLQIFESGVNSTAAACVMAIIVLSLGLVSTVGVCASTSRLLWSFSRDGGMPFGKHLVKLTKNRVPLVANLVSAAITMLLALSALRYTAVQSAIFSLVVSALFSSYLLVFSLLLWRRTSRFIEPYIAGDSPLASGTLAWGPWRLPEPFGTVNNIFACLYSILLLFWSFWPQTASPTLESANWSVLVLGAAITFCVFWYFMRAKKFYNGPLRDI